MAALLTGLLHFSGATNALDRWLYDQSLSMSPGQGKTSTSVLLVSASSELLASRQNRQLLVERIDELGANGIAFSTPIKLDESVTLSGQNLGWIIAPNKFYDPRAHQDFTDPGSENQNHDSLFVGFEPSTDGILRTQRMEFFDTDGPGPSLEAAIADRWFDGQWSPPKETFWIDFSSRDDSLPTIPADVVLEGGLVPELVQNRVVLIGLERDLSMPGINGPIRSALPMTPLEAHGYAVNSLLTQTWNSVLSTRARMTLVVVGTLFVYLLCLRFHRQRRRLVGVLLGMELVASWIALNYGHVWFSLGTLWIAQICTTISCSALSRWQLTKLIDRVDFRTRTRLRLRKNAHESAAVGPAELLGLQIPERSRSVTDTSLELCRTLDWLHLEMDLMENLFDQAGTGLAIYDANGTLMRINRSLRSYLSDRTQEDYASSLNSVRREVTRVLRDNAPASFTCHLQHRSAEAQVHVRPIEFSWSSPLAPFESTDVLRVKFVICEWILPHVGASSEDSADADQREIVAWSRTAIANRTEANYLSTPIFSGFDTEVMDFTDTRKFDRPLRHYPDPIEEEDLISIREPESEAVVEPVYE